MPVQAAELHLRQRLAATRTADVELVRRSVDGDVTAATFVVAGAAYVVRVRTFIDPETATRLTCKAHRDNPIPRHEPLSVERSPR